MILLSFVAELLESAIQIQMTLLFYYQTLLGSIIHKYLTGRLVDIEEAKKLLKTG